MTLPTGDDLVLHPAVAADEDRLLEWRNLPTTVEFSTLKKTVSPDEHHDWFNRVLSNPDRSQIFIATYGEAAIGTVRYDRTETKTANISAYLLPDYYGSGLGHRVITLSLAEIAGKWPDLMIVDALVLTDNPRGVRAFSKAGFVEMPVCDEPAGHVRYSVTLTCPQPGQPTS